MQDLRKQLDEQKRRSKRQHIHSTNGRFLTLPQAEAAFHSQQEEQASCLAAQAQQQAQREEADRVRELQRAENALNKMFSAPLGSYTCKDDLKDIVAAFGLDQKGMIAEILGRCQKHMDTHSELATNPHFAKLFSVRHTRVHRTQATDGAVHGPPSSLSVLTPPGLYANPDMPPPPPHLLPYPNSCIPPNLPPHANSHILPPNLPPYPSSHTLPPNLPQHPNSHIRFPPSNFGV